MEDLKNDNSKLSENEQLDERDERKGDSLLCFFYSFGFFSLLIMKFFDFVESYGG